MHYDVKNGHLADSLISELLSFWPRKRCFVGEVQLLAFAELLHLT